jgi:hypothetical protein
LQSSASISANDHLQGDHALQGQVPGLVQTGELIGAEAYLHSYPVLQGDAEQTALVFKQGRACNSQHEPTWLVKPQ